VNHPPVLRVQESMPFVNTSLFHLSAELITMAQGGDMKRERKPEDVEIGRRIRRFREAAGFDRKTFAACIHVSPHTLAVYENGWRGPARPVLQRIAENLGISVDALLGAEPEEAVVRTITLRRSLGSLAEEIDPRYRELIKVYTFRQQVEHADIPDSLRRELLRDIDQVIADYQQHMHERVR